MASLRRRRLLLFAAYLSDLIGHGKANRALWKEGYASAVGGSPQYFRSELRSMPLICGVKSEEGHVTFVSDHIVDIRAG